MKKIKVSREFLNQFNSVVEYYKCNKQEVEWLKDRVRSDYDAVSKSIKIMYEEIELEMRWKKIIKISG